MDHVLRKLQMKQLTKSASYWGLTLAITALAVHPGCSTFTKLGNRLKDSVGGNETEIVKESASGELYPNVRFQSPDGSGSRHNHDGSGSRQDESTSLPPGAVKMRRTFGENERASRDQAPQDPANIVTAVEIKGNVQMPTHELMRYISTRPGRYFDPDRLQQDVDKIWRLPEIRKINGPYVKRSESGVAITIEVVERKLVRKVKFVGNRGVTDRALEKETGLEDGQPLDLHAVQMTKTKIEDYYKEKGYPRTQVEVVEGNEAEDENIVFLIHEDTQQRVWQVEFEGNTFASDARLRNFVKSKPGILKVFGGLVKRDEIEQDIMRLANYYRKYGFFNAQIGREISESNDGRWLTLRFIINEGPRYKVRNISFVGNRFYQSTELDKLVQLKTVDNKNPDYNVGKLNEDVVALRDLYGSKGFVFIKVDAEPRFLEDPGWMDIVYKIDEGEQYRVGKINVRIDGDYGITKREVALTRLSLRPGDLIDVKKLRDSERRLGASQIFAGANAGGGGAPPQIQVIPSGMGRRDRTARGSSVSSSNHGSGSQHRH